MVYRMIHIFDISDNGGIRLRAGFNFTTEKEGTYVYFLRPSTGYLRRNCDFEGCSESRPSGRELIHHERIHFGWSGRQMCLEEECQFTPGHWSDLGRHYISHHCRNLHYFPCAIIDCKYSNPNGSIRKDKLTSRYNKVHLD